MRPILFLAGLAPAITLAQATTAPAPPGNQTPPGTERSEPLPTVTVTAPEPRYVAPTLRDRIGRIWAPVYLNGKGPYRLVLDTGASRSAVIPRVSEDLGLAARTQRSVRVRGVTGTAVVPLLRIDSMEIGDLLLEPAMLPVVPDVFGGADGVLGNEGMRNMRIFIDFRRDQITVKRSKREQPGPGYRTLPLIVLRDYLLAIEVTIGRVSALAIIDTGAPESLGNLALMQALKRAASEAPAEEVVGVTLDVEYADRVKIPTIRMAGVAIRHPAVAFADVHIFKHWRLTDQPAILLGMDVLGRVEQIVIDYRMRQMHLKLNP